MKKVQLKPGQIYIRLNHTLSTRWTDGRDGIEMGRFHQDTTYEVVEAGSNRTLATIPNHHPFRDPLETARKVLFGLDTNADETAVVERHFLAHCDHVKRFSIPFPVPIQENLFNTLQDWERGQPLPDLGTPKRYEYVYDAPPANAQPLEHALHTLLPENKHLSEHFPMPFLMHLVKQQFDLTDHPEDLQELKQTARQLQEDLQVTLIELREVEGLPEAGRSQALIWLQHHLNLARVMEDAVLLLHTHPNFPTLSPVADTPD